MSEEVERPECKWCGSSNTGKKENPNRFKCYDCGRSFRVKMDVDTISDTIEREIHKGVGHLNITLPEPEGDRIRLVPLGDIHVGAPEGQCDIKKVVSELNYILKTPDTYMIGMGDFMDSAKKVGRGPNIFMSSLSPQQQYDLILKLFRPLAEKGKIIGLHCGNHEEWITQSTGIQVIYNLCETLGVPFLGYACDITIHVGKQTYLGYSQHGSSSAKMKHTKLGAAIKATGDIFADFFLYGHVHQIGVQKGGKRLGGKQNKCYYILTGHFLNWEGSYAQAFGMDVGPSGCPQIKFFVDRHDIHVSV